MAEDLKAVWYDWASIFGESKDINNFIKHYYDRIKYYKTLEYDMEYKQTKGFDHIGVKQLHDLLESEVKGGKSEYIDYIRRPKPISLDIPEIGYSEIPEAYEFKKPEQLDMFGNNNYRYQQPNKMELQKFILDYGVKHVVRMNGDGGDTDYGMTIDDEKKIVEGLGAEFTFVNAHIGYLPGRGYMGSLSQVFPILDSGNVMIHCHHGADRTGYMVAAYLQENTSMTNDELWEYTIQFNSWGGEYGKVCSGSNVGYAKYLDAFYPLDEWCSVVPYRENWNCNLCNKLKQLGF